MVRPWRSAELHQPGVLLICDTDPSELLTINTDLLFGIGPARDLDDHVQDSLLLIGVQGNVVERRDGDAILLDECAVFQGVRSTNTANTVLRSGCHVEL